MRKAGIAPRAIVWPYGRSNGAAQQIASELGMTVGMTLEDGTNTAITPLVTIKRFLIEDTPSLQSYAEAVRQRWLPDPQRSVRVVPSGWADPEDGLSRTLDQLQRIAPNIAFVDPRAAGACRALPDHAPPGRRRPPESYCLADRTSCRTRAGDGDTPM